MNLFERFCNAVDLDKLNRIERAISFAWYHSKQTGELEFNTNTIHEYFSLAGLAKYNTTKLVEELKKTKKVNNGSKRGFYRLTRDTIQCFEEEHCDLFEKAVQVEIKIHEQAALENTPFLNETDISAAKQMAELYIILHCYENSVRRLIENTLLKDLGTDWWNLASNAHMSRKYKERLEKEQKNKWLSNRGESSPLYYLDWSDLVSIIRKYETNFSHKFHDIKFVELRLEELEKVRNIIAHNGALPSDDDFQRVILSFKDWCKQVAD